METVVIDRERCTLCGSCIDDCVRRILVEGDDCVRVTDPSMCIMCGHCKAICPEDAVSLPSLDESEFSPMPDSSALPDKDSLANLFRSRRSIRQYKKDPVEKEKLEEIVQAGRFAPTGGNRQPIKYVVVSDPENLEKVRAKTISVLLEEADRMEAALKEAEETGAPPDPVVLTRQVYIEMWRNLDRLYKEGADRLFFHAPALIVLYADPTASVNAAVDAGIAGMQMALMAEPLGLGSCYCGFLCFALAVSSELKDMLGVPQGNVVPVTMMVGYPDVTYERWVSRKPAEVHWM